MNIEHPKKTELPTQFNPTIFIIRHLFQYYQANTSIIKIKNGESRGKKSPNQRASYRAATTRTSELIPPWPEDSKEPLKSSYDDDELL